MNLALRACLASLLVLALTPARPARAQLSDSPSTHARAAVAARVLAHREQICARARAYDVRPDHLARLLEMNLNAYDVADRLQDAGASQGWFFRLYGYRPGDARPEHTYAAHRREDAARERRGELNPARDQRTHWIFTSFGPGQVQLYVARLRAPIVRAHGGRAPLEWGALARELVSFEGAIEFLAAGLREMIDAYRERAGLDLSDRYGMLHELHMGGSVVQRADRRREAERRGRPLPLALESPSAGLDWRRAFADCGAP